MLDSRWYKLFAGVPSEASWHPEVFFFLGEIFMGLVSASADGHFAESLLCIFEEMEADHMHKGLDPCAR